MTPERRARREAFANEVHAVAAKHQLPLEDTVDSLLTMIVGVFVYGGAPQTALIERVKQAWEFARKHPPETL